MFGQSATKELTVGPKCILLAGSARGGTSWALKVLDSHPAVCGSHEPFYQLSGNADMAGLCNRVKAGNTTEDDRRQLIQRSVEACIQTHKPPFFPKDFLRTPAWIQNAAWMAGRAIAPLESTFRFLATGHLNQNHRLVIKNRPFPQLESFLQALDADAIQLLRHPCGVISSWLKGIEMGVMDSASQDADNTWNRYSALLGPLGLSPEQLQRMSPAGVLAVNWLVDILLFRQYEALGIRTTTAVYCDLVKNPVEEWTRVFQWMGLEITPSVVSFLENSGSTVFDLRALLGKRYTYFSVKRSDKSPMYAWRKHLSTAQIQEILETIQPHFPLERYWPEITAELPQDLVPAA